MNVNTEFLRIPSQRDLFELPEGETYLNCATLSPQLRSVSTAGSISVRSKAEPWRFTPQDWFTDTERLRDMAARVFGADAGEIAFVPSVSYGMATAAQNVDVSHGQKIILLHDEFPSGYYAWREAALRQDAEMHIVHNGEDGDWTSAILEAIDERTAVVSVPHCHWTDGSLIDLERISIKTHSVGASLVIDASQSLGACPLDLAKVRPDFVVAVGYKWLLGPYSLGYMYVAPHRHEGGKPIENSWLNRAGSEDFRRLVDYADDYRPGARRFDVGECSNFVLVPMAMAALRQVLEWRIENIQHTLSGLTDLIATGAARLGWTGPSRGNRIGHMIGIRPRDGIPPDLSGRLASENVHVSIRGNAIRISPHLYNDQTDIQKLFSILQRTS